MKFTTGFQNIPTSGWPWYFSHQLTYLMDHEISMLVASLWAAQPPTGPEVWTRLRGVSFTTWSPWVTSCGDRGVDLGKVFWCGNGRNELQIWWKILGKTTGESKTIHSYFRTSANCPINYRCTRTIGKAFELCCIVDIYRYPLGFLAFGEMQRNWKWVRCSSPTQRDPFPWWRCRLQKRWWVGRVGMMAWSFRWFSIDRVDDV